MRVGFIGSGSMAAAMARGWAAGEGGPSEMLFTDSGSGRAGELAAEVGGEAVVSNRELAGRCDLAVLAVKPAALEQVAAEAGAAPAVLSLLGATTLRRVAEAFPAAAAFRAMPNVAVEVRRGVLCYEAAASAPAETGGRVREMLGLLGHLVETADEDFDAATAVMGCAPAYLALAVEAISEAGARDGLDPELSRSLVIETTAGTAELLRIRHPADVRRAVASPGGSTEAGLEALDAGGAAEAFAAAVRASLERMRRE
ncbi:MAG: pyrroline-5-carboxylate reductase dimerization domain-containing protein [Solirubrobacterales bacterium]